tara:strand:+ start:36221 stop:41209 length:4989 start_codon:yes stop_codon:yes gene_type:complete
MAAGTWNQGRLEKRVEKIKLNEYPTIQFEDASLTSEQVFNVVEFPNRFTAGKNLIKIRASAKTLVKNSTIHIEVLDSNGDPMYYEPLNYLEHDGTRVIAIHVYPDKTAPGIGTIYLAGRIKETLDTGESVPFSRNWKDINYYNNPNIIWSRNISIAPENSKNKTEIIFTRPYPKATVRERVNRFFTPINLTDVAVDKPGSGTVTISAIPSTTQPPVSIKSPYAAASKGSSGVKKQTNFEGAASAKTPMKSVGKQVVVVPKVKKFNTTPADEAANKKGQPVEVESAQIVTISTFSRLETSGFVLSSSMEGGTITIVNPNVNMLQGNSFIDTDGRLIPVSQPTDWAGVTSYELGDPSIQLSGSYTFVIDKILSSTKANVFLTNGFKNEEENTYGAFSFITIGAQSQYEIKDINATSNFTCSYVEPFILSETQQSQSFAEIVLSNIEPATGDVHKIQTLYKPSGQFGDFIDAGYVEVEEVEIFEDVTSFESIPGLGVVYNRIGFFTDLGDFNKYWETTNGSITPDVTLTPSYDSDVLLDGIEFTPDSTFDNTSNRFGYIHLKSEYHVKVFEDTRYVLSFNAVADDTTHTSSDPDIKYSRLDVYISGSNSSIETDSEYINQYLISNLDVDNNLSGDLINNGKLGTRVSTIEIKPGITYNDIPIFTYFKTLREENIDVYFVVRRGKWAISNLSLKSNKQTGFSPNFTRINTRIPSEFLETPLTFKFLYYDINNNKAQAETTVYPVTFYGDNLVISGDNNLLSGSVYIGNTIGSGIELAGVNSGFIRSIGYEGFISASRTDQPGGFMLYTGSVLPGAPDNYSGVGIEIVQDSSSFFKFDTEDGIDIRAKKFFIGSEASQFVSGSTGKIEISSSNFHLKPDGGLIIGGDTVINADLSVEQLFVPAGTTAAGSGNKAFINSSGIAKFSGDGAGSYKVEFDGAGTSKIGGWVINDDNITGDQMIIRSNGTIESDGFQSNVPGSGFRLTAASGGFLEVENARIRGTLSTAVFEKETVNAVGGQLYVANSTTLTGSAENPGGSYTATDTTMSVVNASGFAVGEILTAKKISATGFNTEYLLVNSASRASASSDTDFSGKIFVQRAYGQGQAGGSGSLGGSPGGAVPYTGSQVIVSTGKQGTGYIRLNANPNDEYTPYMQIVERTGSGIYDLDLKAQLGDLKGITDTINGEEVTGFGLYTDNAFLKGGIVATYGSIGALSIGSQSISIGNNRYNDTNTKFFVSSSGKFSLGQKFKWDGSDLTIAGTITITNPGDIDASQIDNSTSGFTDDSTATEALTSASIAQTSASAAQTDANTANALALASVNTANAANVTAQAAQATANAIEAVTQSLTNPAEYTFGGNGFTLGTHNPNTGLNQTHDFFGYFEGSSPKTFMSSSGDFFLGGTGGAFVWDESEGALKVSGSLVSLNVRDFFLGSENQFISGANGNIEISSSNFHLTTQGDLTASNADFDGFAIARSLRQKAVTITQANMHQYCRQLIKGENSNGELNGQDVDNVVSTTTEIVLDGSLGGEITSHVIINVDLASQSPDDANFTAGQLEVIGEGTVPSSDFQRISSNIPSEIIDVYPNGTHTMDASADDGTYAFGGIRKITSPNTPSGAKVPVTIEIGDDVDVDMYVPVGIASGGSPFGNIYRVFTEQMNYLPPQLRAGPGGG